MEGRWCRHCFKKYNRVRGRWRGGGGEVIVRGGGGGEGGNTVFCFEEAN